MPTSVELLLFRRKKNLMQKGSFLLFSFKVKAEQCRPYLYITFSQLPLHIRSKGFIWLFNKNQINLSQHPPPWLKTILKRKAYSKPSPNQLLHFTFSAWIHWIDRNKRNTEKNLYNCHFIDGGINHKTRYWYSPLLSCLLKPNKK